MAVVVELEPGNYPMMAKLCSACYWRRHGNHLQQNTEI